MLMSFCFWDKFCENFGMEFTLASMMSLTLLPYLLLYFLFQGSGLWFDLFNLRLGYFSLLWILGTLGFFSIISVCSSSTSTYCTSSWTLWISCKCSYLFFYSTSTFVMNISTFSYFLNSKPVFNGLYFPRPWWCMISSFKPPYCWFTSSIIFKFALFCSSANYRFYLIFLSSFVWKNITLANWFESNSSNGFNSEFSNFWMFSSLS